MSTNGDPRLRDYLAAVEKHAKLCQLAAALPERIAEAEAAVVEEATKIGVPPPRPQRARNGGKFDGSLQEKILAALPGSAAEVGAKIGVRADQVGGNLRHYLRDGLVTRTGKSGQIGGRGYVYHRATDGEDRAA